jgi:hypothetical protein
MSRCLEKSPLKADDYGRHILDHNTFDRTPAAVGTAPLLQDLLANPVVEISTSIVEDFPLDKMLEAYPTLVLLGTRAAVQVRWPAVTRG